MECYNMFYYTVSEHFLNTPLMLHHTYTFRRNGTIDPVKFYYRILNVFVAFCVYKILALIIRRMNFLGYGNSC